LLFAGMSLSRNGSYPGGVLVQYVPGVPLPPWPPWPPPAPPAPLPPTPSHDADAATIAQKNKTPRPTKRCCSYMISSRAQFRCEHCEIRRSLFQEHDRFFQIQTQITMSLPGAGLFDVMPRLPPVGNAAMHVEHFPPRVRHVHYRITHVLPRGRSDQNILVHLRPRGRTCINTRSAPPDTWQTCTNCDATLPATWQLGVNIHWVGSDTWQEGANKHFAPADEAEEAQPTGATGTGLVSAFLLVFCRLRNGLKKRSTFFGLEA
jgi:hypothetical protein